MPIELDYALPAPLGLLPRPNPSVPIPPFLPQLIPPPWSFPVPGPVLPPGSQSAIQQQSATQSATQTRPAMGPHLPIGPVMPFGPMMHPPNYPFPIPFAMLPQPAIPQPSSTQGNVRGRGGVGHSRPSSRSRPRRHVARTTNQSRAGSARGRSSSRSTRPIPQQPSNRPPTPDASEGSPKTQTITTSQAPMSQEAPKTPPAQRDPSPDPSPTSRDLEVLRKATGSLTI
ncbi:hypothetical protein F5Y00DRAFT_270952 [Daldinia vernicosa]|uniref:uncharacterized protein n=1 Tax=Daldinia vernicosa TaxID=114800 RepID=UPI0020089CB3|nr:uncharacterized protein F5Y00DRAFT_270952 [Daldinia vernicosa]KAI0847823.1 hypothetical protein F5Y00DRAFT_270952 [Daldinia vernicosa]